VLILDEVFAVGDFAFAKKCEKRLAELLSSGATFILVSHATGFLLENCQRCLWLEHGRLVADGPTAQVVSGYLGDPVALPGTSQDAGSPAVPT